jgi:hypothetical protein
VTGYSKGGGGGKGEEGEEERDGQSVDVRGLEADEDGGDE